MVIPSIPSHRSLRKNQLLRLPHSSDGQVKKVTGVTSFQVVQNATFSQRKGNDMRVLVADGDEAFLEILQCYLWDRGHEAEVAADGLECITILGEFVPDIVLLERELIWGRSSPRSCDNGKKPRWRPEYEPFWRGSQGVLAHMRGARNFSETPVIMMAEGDPLEEFEPEPNPPLVGWLRKPFRLSDLLEQITTAARATQVSNIDTGVK
jgi:CheY-like chemotaxis protein